MALKANEQLRENIKTLLHARGHTARDLAEWCRRTDSWMSKILATHSDREFRMEYIDRIADFFGVATYQLFQPGVAEGGIGERRSGADRRGHKERRVRGGLSRLDVPTSQHVALMQLISYGTEHEQSEWIRMIGDQLRGRRFRPPSDTLPAVPSSTGATGATVQSQMRRRTQSPAK